MSHWQSEEEPLLPERRPEGPLSDVPDESGGRYYRWKRQTAEGLESKRLHQAVIALIVVDATCVLADLSYTFLTDECSAAAKAPAWLEVLSNISITITTFFLIEIPLTLWALGPRYYNPSKVPHASLHLFDAIIIIVTFVLEFILKGRERELAGLLIILRLWRLVKLVGGIAVGAGEIDEELSETLAETRRQLAEKTQALAQATEDNRLLRTRLEGGSKQNDNNSLSD